MLRRTVSNTRPAARSTTAEEDDTPREDGGGEHCYGHNMPIATSAGWSFVDLGKRKGVAKLGWESYKVGQTLTMGPLFNTSRRECGMLKMALGYHSSWDHELGALHISCGDGCTCILDLDLGPSDALPGISTSFHRKLHLEKIMSWLQESSQLRLMKSTSQ